MDKRIDSVIVLLTFCASTFFSYIGEDWISGLCAGVAFTTLWVIVFLDMP